jgi:peptidoglycan/xylan/chitin deacetylase (PgdA/CDA1 family)
VIRKIREGLKNPFYSASYIMGNIQSNYFRHRYIKKSKENNIHEKYFILSFDCDTEKDIEVVEDVHARLNKYKINPSYAVPGELLKLGSDVYSKLKKNGAEFINHGYLSHTSYNEINRSYLSTLFYDQLTNNEVKEDIIKGHHNFIDVLGEKPLGFRTPHFGTYQKSSQLKFLYAVLADLGYSFSSSTTPVEGMWNGAIQKKNTGIFEIPVSGSYDYPARILDSWGYRFSPTRKLNENDYMDQFKKMMNFFANPNTSGVFNIYADPSQVYDWEMFFECMDMTSGLVNISFSDLIKEVNV